MSNFVIPHETNNQAFNMQSYRQKVIKTTGFSRFVFLGLFVIGAFVGGSIYWAINATLDGAVVAPASFVVEGNRKTVQHLEGGIIQQLFVKEGDFVEKDQTLIRLDSTDNDVNLTVLSAQIGELMIRRERLISELNDKETFSLDNLPERMRETFQRENLAVIFETQKQLFNTQLETRKSEQEILSQRIVSLEEEIEGLEQQLFANQNQMEIAKEELSTLTKLFKQGYVASTRVNAIRREIEQLKVQKALFKTDQARAKNQIGELKLSDLGQKKLRQETVTTELASVETQIANIEPQYLGALQRQKRIEVKAPVSGRIVNLAIYTQGGVIRPGEAILDIVPAQEELVIEAKINTSDIEKLKIGQATRIRLTAFDQVEVPEAQGRLIDLSADSIQDERTGSDYFLAKVRLDKEQIEAVKELNFIPGMPADVFINTGERTAFSYLMQPIRERVVRTFTE